MGLGDGIVYAPAARVMSLEVEPLSPADRAWLRMDRPDNPMVITALLTFDEPLGRADLERLIEERLLLLPRFRQRLAAGDHGSVRRWELDADFDLRGHLRHVALPSGDDNHELQTMVSDCMSTPLDVRRPLWQFHLVDGYLGGSAVICRMHHALADGVALVRLLRSLTEPEGASSWKAPARPSTLEAARHQLAQQAREVAAHPRHVVELAQRGAAGAMALGRLLALSREPATSLKGPLGANKRAAWSHPIELAQLKDLAHRHNAKVNDVLATLVGGAVRRYLRNRGERGSAEVRAAMPVNLRNAGPEPALGNRFGLVFLGLPIELESPVDRLHEVARRTRALKVSGEASATFGVLCGMAFGSDAVDDMIVDLFEAKATLVLTSVVGPEKPVSIFGRRVSSIAFWVPQAGRLGLGVSMFSYAGKVHIATASDAKRIATPSEFVQAIEADLVALDADSR
jgi:WS/DGAT/MGAT family acyltransferase